MLESIDKIHLKGIDKASWQPFRFDEIAFNINEKVDPTNTDLDIYVGLEHLDPESIHIKRFGKRDDVKGTKLRVYPGDIVFGRRRAYQRKAAIAEFDGFCSAHALVLRANPEVIDPKLFPFFLHSDAFMNRAVDISVGSLSPTINWGTLKKEEFLLPPKEQQARLAELLWAADRVKEDCFILQEKTINSYQVHLENLFNKKSGWDLVRLDEVAYINQNTLKSSTDQSFEFKYLDIASITGPKLVGELISYKFKDSPSRARRILKKGSIVLSLVRPYHKAFVMLENPEGIISSTGTGVVDVKEIVLNRFLFHQFFCNRFQLFCEMMMSGTNYPAITPENLKQFKVFIPRTLETQNKIADQLDHHDFIITQLRLNLKTITELKNSFINQIF